MKIACGSGEPFPASPGARGAVERRNQMRKKIHPKYKPTKIVCHCGNVIETRSTNTGDTHLDICSNCHPFYTGKQKLIDSAGRIEKFRKKFSKENMAAKNKGGKKTKAKAAKVDS